MMKTTKFIVDQKYVSNYFDFVIIRPFKKDDLAKITLLLMMLLERSKNYPSKGKLSEKLDHLYGAGLAINHTVYFDKIIITFSGYVLDEKFAKENIYEEYMQFFSEIIYDHNPKRFRSSDFSLVKKNAINSLKQVFDSPAGISNYGLFTALDQQSILASGKYGRIKDYSQVKLRDIVELHQELITTPGTIIGVGPKNIAEATKNLRKWFLLTPQSQKINTIPLTIDSLVEITKEKDIKQSVITVGYLLGKGEYKNYAKGLFNMMVGGGGISKLFSEIREKHGLCYSISSRIDPMTNLVIITLGVDKERIAEAISAIKEVMRNLTFNDHDFASAKKLFLSEVVSSFDSQKRTAQGYLIRSLRRNATGLTQIRKIVEKNSLEIINAMAKNLTYVGYYVLKGTKDE